MIKIFPMQKGPLPSYKNIFQQILDTKNFSVLESYYDKELWFELDIDERHLLAELFLLQAEANILNQLNDEQKLEDCLKAVDLLVSDNLEMFFRTVMIYFRFGLKQKKTSFFQQAIEKILYFQSKFRDYFDHSYEIWHLWGNIQLAFGQYSAETELCAQSIKKFEAALTILIKKELSEEDPFKKQHLKNQRAEIYWHWGLAWFLLGKKSGESADFAQACHQYSLAEAHFNTPPPAFYMDYGTAYSHLGKLQGKSAHLLSAIDFFKKAIVESYPFHEQSASERTSESIYFESWMRCAESWRFIYELSGNPDYLPNADECFQHALVICPKKDVLWLEWAKMHLSQAWFDRDVYGFETCIEKLTSIHSEKCNVPKLCSYFSQALSGLGILWDDLKFIREGVKRTLDLIDLFPDHPELLCSAALGSLAFGQYFSEEKYYIKGIGIFEILIQDPHCSAEHLYGYYQCVLGLAELIKDFQWMEKGLKTIERLCELRPECGYYWNDWGAALLKLKDFDSDTIDLQEVAKDALVKFEKALELRKELETQPEVEWLFNYACGNTFFAEALEDEGYYEKAISLFRELLDKNPSHTQARYQLALTLSYFAESASDVESFQEAISIFENLANNDYEDDALWFDWGYALLCLSELVKDPLIPEKNVEALHLAEGKLLRSASLGNTQVYFILACLYSLKESYELAIEYLKKSHIAGVLPSVDELMHEEWLENLRNTDNFHNFIGSLRG